MQRLIEENLWNIFSWTVLDTSYVIYLYKMHVYSMTDIQLRRLRNKISLIYRNVNTLCKYINARRFNVKINMSKTFHRSLKWESIMIKKKTYTLSASHRNSCRPTTKKSVHVLTLCTITEYQVCLTM